MFTPKSCAWQTRAGILHINGTDITTPNFIVGTARLAIPHLTPDHANQPPLAAVYAEDTWDKGGLVSACLNRSTLPLSSPLLLGAVRNPEMRPLKNKPNTDSAIAISTSQGSQMASMKDVSEFMNKLNPDIVVIPYDFPAQSPNSSSVGKNRVVKMTSRSLKWAKELYNSRPKESAFVAVTLPPQLQTSEYLNEVNTLCNSYCFNDGCETMTRLAADSAAPDASKLRISMFNSGKLSDVINDIAAGIDLVNVPLTQYADKGYALTVSFKNPGADKGFLNLYDDEFIADTSLLHNSGFMKGYIHHLLEAREMTAHVILQLHNTEILKQLFNEIQESITEGTFSTQAEKFKQAYETL
ncbi:hypothetical protein DASB73_003540 [Starmerella bacillaris]|uniref:tRNA-guanine(15) transglycosylase-like domain-containing protein n=1 Tax=Starmerella bacillaris TaxID=1247836 RepID=A0AAV5RCV1_STABA|nr:hypothetical protein DASB73_003540 [Starmerella bacillaris]